MAEKSVTLNPGESKVVSFEATPTEARTYQVSVDGLTGSFSAVAPAVTPCPCVYCGATFTTEAGLIAHMEASHPGKPYVVYAYPEGPAPYGEYVGIKYKVYTPKVPGTEYTACYFFTFYIPGYYVWEPFNGAYVVLDGGTPEGFYEGSAAWRAMYLVSSHPRQYANIPRGTYPLYSRCRHRADVGEYEWGTIKTFWEDVDTGVTIEVVSPEPNIEVHYLKVSPTEVNVGDTVEITAAMRNVGGAAGTGTLEVTVNGISLGTRTATLNPGQYHGWLFYCTPETAGVYLVEADGITKSFTAV